jgi:hypothetical protein
MANTNKNSNKVNENKTIEPKKGSGDIVFVSMSEQIEPKFKISRQNNYVSFGERTNSWGRYLQDLLNRCPIHSSIFKTKVRLTRGGGFYLKNENELLPAQLKKYNSFYDSFPVKDLHNNFLKKTAYDLQLYGHFYWKIIYSRNGKQIVNIEHIDADRILPGKFNKDGFIDEFYYCNDWQDERNNEIITYDALNEDNAGGEQILQIKDYNSGIEGNYFGKESYRASINAILASYHIINLHRANLQNGMHPSVVISFKDEPTTEEKDIIFRKIKKLYAGSDNSGKFILTFGVDGGPVITPINANDTDKLYTTLLDQIISYILVGHSVPPILAGIKTPGQMGGRTEIIEQSELFYTNVIQGDQDLILEGLQRILKFNKLDFAKVAIKRTSPVKFMFDSNTLNLITTINERRAIADFPAINSEFANMLPNSNNKQPTNAPLPLSNGNGQLKINNQNLLS